MTDSVGTWTTRASTRRLATTTPRRVTRPVDRMRRTGDPVAGTVRSTNTLLGHDGFVGVKTGSDDAAGGCFAFRAIRWIDGKRTTITGVVLGQPGHDRIAAGLAAAEAMVDRIADHSPRPATARE